MNETLLIKSSNVFDGISFVGRKEILVRDRKIVNVGNGISCKNVIDLGDMFISPGFIDAHIHFGGFKFDEFAQSFVYERDESLLLSCIPSLKKVLDSGFTTVRACGGKYDIHLRDAVKAGYIDGPDIIAAGNALTQTFGHGELSHTLPVELVDGYFGKVCDGVPECIKATRTVLRDGADFIKIITTGGALSQGDSTDFSLMTSSRLLPSMYSITRNGWLSTFPMSYTETMFGWFNLAVVCASLLNLEEVSSSSEVFIIFTATVLLSISSEHLNTIPFPPSPSFLTTTYLPSENDRGISPPISNLSLDNEITY